ncbi:uncharacterized protein [Aegilops tauschii subsp. strangulata]|uniref:uncharacterized protein n=1 Tax=Aegilops tauschii subsp. strangulata TaxID=200361 RepID=UPI003CC83F2B
MARHVFNRIREGMVAYHPYFECKQDALGKLGFPSYQKCTAAIRMLTYAIPGDLVDEYIRMSESTCLLSMYSFCKAVVTVFGPEYLREPTTADTERLLAINAKRGFPGMLGSIDSFSSVCKACRRPLATSTTRDITLLMKFWEVMTACLIMHNMITEDERDNSIYDQWFDFQGENVEPEQPPPATFDQFVHFHRELRDWRTHVQLQDDLLEHMWTHIGN